MNRPLRARDRVNRGTASGRTSGRGGIVPRSGGLVGGVANPRSGAETRKAAGFESGGGGKRSSVGSRFDGVSPLVANLLAGDGQAVVLRQRAARDEHGSGGVF